jgi:membrane fusion protein, multidrug efflux system
MSKTTIAIIAAAALVAGIIIYNKALHPPEKKPANMAGKERVLQVSAVVAAPTILDNNVIASGTLVPSEEVDLHSQISGIITSLRIREGSPVAKGALLVKLFDSDLQAQLEKLNAQLAIARETEERLKQLLAVNGVGRQDYDNALLQVKSLGADIDNIKAQIEKTEIRAPFSGVLGLRNVSEGAYLTPAVTVATLSKTDPLKIDFSIPELYASQVHAGDRLTFTVAGFREKFSATVYAVEPRIDEDTRTLKVRAVVKNPDARLHAGAFANVELALATIDSALMVPSQCVILDVRSKKVVVAKGAKAEMRVVTTGIRTESAVQITSGLSAGDTVVTSSLLFVKPGMDLKVAVSGK